MSNDNQIPPAAAPSGTSTPPAGETVPVTVTEATTEQKLLSIDAFLEIDLRVARIESAEAVPKSKKLIKLQLDVGHLGKRQILSGVAQFYTPESLVGKLIVIVANLQPAKLMGIESQGMLLAASPEDNSKLIIIDPGQDMAPGSRVR